MKLRSDHKTCTNELLKLFTLDKFLILPYMKDKGAVGFTKHRLNLVDTDVTVFSGLILCQSDFLFNGDYSFGLASILHFDSPPLHFDVTVLGLAMETNMRAELCVRTLENAAAAYPGLKGAIIHSDRGSQYTSAAYRQAVTQYDIRQSMNRAGGRCHDNARCESMWARMKSELFYDRLDTEQLTVEELRSLIWRYFMSCWNNRRICSANGGLPPAVKRERFYLSLTAAAA